MIEKHQLRKAMRARRKAHSAAIPESVRALLFLRPPVPVAAMIPEGDTVGLYLATGGEAPATRYAQWLIENGRNLALPAFSSRDAPMEFRAWRDPFGLGDIVDGPFGLRQPADDAPRVTPGTLIVPLVAFNARCERLGQGAGHYDSWIAAHSGVTTIGLAWDCQLVDEIPTEPHDVALDAIVTETRFYERAG